MRRVVRSRLLRLCSFFVVLRSRLFSSLFVVCALSLLFVVASGCVRLRFCFVSVCKFVLFVSVRLVFLLLRSVVCCSLFPRFVVFVVFVLCICAFAFCVFLFLSVSCLRLRCLLLLFVASFLMRFLFLFCVRVSVVIVFVCFVSVSFSTRVRRCLRLLLFVPRVVSRCFVVFVFCVFDPCRASPVALHRICFCAFAIRCCMRVVVFVVRCVCCCVVSRFVFVSCVRVCLSRLVFVLFLRVLWFCFIIITRSSFTFV